MPTNFQQRALALDQRIEQVERDLQHATPTERLRFEALRASLLRSVRWYRARAGTRTDIHALNATVGDEITTAEAGV